MDSVIKFYAVASCACCPCTPWIRTADHQPYVGLNPFCVWLRICQGIRLFIQSSPLISTFSTVKFTYLFVFAIWFPFKGMRANNSFLEDYRGVIRFPQSHWHRGIWSPGINDTAESASAVSLRLGFFYKNFIKVGYNSLIETAETDPAVSLRPRNPNFAKDYLEYLGEYESICETALAGFVFY
jgi:hypothetical protein